MRDLGHVKRRRVGTSVGYTQNEAIELLMLLGSKERRVRRVIIESLFKQLDVYKTDRWPDGNGQHGSQVVMVDYKTATSNQAFLLRKEMADQAAIDGLRVDVVAKRIPRDNGCYLVLMATRDSGLLRKREADGRSD